MGVESLVELVNVVALAGGFPVLSGLSFEVNPGEVVLLRGPNGAGKTSALRLCAGLIPPHSGSAQVLGCDLFVDRVSFRPRVGFAGHSTGLYEDLTAEENIRFAADAYKVSSDQVTKVCETFSIGRALRNTPSKLLSAGQRRRVSLSCIFVRQPEILLLDEPHAGLDAETRDALDDTLRGYTRSGSAIVFASHELDRSVSLATKQVVLAGGTNSSLVATHVS